MRKGLLSVIIPFYCGMEYIEQQLKSILLSKYNNIEILIIDDGSPEDIGRRCDNLAKLDDRIRVYHKINSGIADTRNYGLSLAEGEFVAFADQDDFVSCEMYGDLINFFEKNKCDIALSNFCSYYCDNNILNNEIIRYEGMVENEKLNMIRKWLVMGEVLDPQPVYNVPAVVWNCVFRMDMIKKNNVKFESFVRYDDDWVFLLRSLEVSKRIYLTKKYYYRWFIHKSSESHTKKFIDSIDIRYERLKIFKLDYMSRCSVNLDEYEKFERYFKANFIYVAALNQMICCKGMSDIPKIIKYFEHLVLSNNENEKTMEAYKMLTKKKGKKAGLIYLLLTNKLYVISYLFILLFYK